MDFMKNYLKNIQIFFDVFFDGLIGIKIFFFSTRKDRFGYFATTATIRPPFFGNKNNIYIYDHCGINSFANFICQKGKFILRRNCSVGPNLTVITFNHKYNTVGQIPEAIGWNNLDSIDVIVNEHVWIGSNVTLCPGTIIGRGSIVAAGSVCIKNQFYPPYSIIGGNPAKFIKYRLSLEDQIQQELLVFNESERLSILELSENFKKVTRIK
jgi:acetyltransferase-like isoleucine patch superfamily enzyme